MLFRWIFFACFFSSCLTLNISGLCERINLCRRNNQSCYPVVTGCQNGSCQYRRFHFNHTRRLNVSNWFYDSNQRDCRQFENQTNDFVYFRFLQDCKRLCLTDERNITDQNTTFQLASEQDTSADRTAYVNLHVDLSPSWMHKLVSTLNVSTPIQNAQAVYDSQMKYFQNYRRRFSNFLDAPHRLMLDYRRKTENKIR